ncbi:hypothetical protein OF83DRAFT_462695 [Amylostereum chailletii]|nr:hypothetical protein OF83DRAFT_462695 [Amylostereum chailletii]
MAPSNAVTPTSGVNARFKCCLITNTTEPPGSVQEFPVLGPSLVTDAKAKNLARQWGVKAIDFDAPENKVQLRMDWYASLINDGWTWVPHDDVIAIIMKRLMALRVKRANAPWNVVYPRYRRTGYCFIPFDSLAHSVVTRNQPPRAGGGVRVYAPPFDDFPMLRHNCHPYFLIHALLEDAVFEHAHSRGQLTGELQELWTRLRTIRSLWHDLQWYPVDPNALDGIPELPSSLVLPLALLGPNRSVSGSQYFSNEAREPPVKKEKKKDVRR